MFSVKLLDLSFDTCNSVLTEDNLVTLPPADKAKRERLLQERTGFYQKLYGNK